MATPTGRLPNICELQSLSDYGQISTLPLGHPFAGVQPSGFYYWSSTTRADISTIYAWRGAPNNGLLSYDGKGITWFVWPVRGGQ